MQMRFLVWRKVAFLTLQTVCDNLSLNVAEREASLSYFVSRQIPGNIQVESMATSVTTVSETKKSNEAHRRSPDLLHKLSMSLQNQESIQQRLSIQGLMSQ